MPNWIYSKEVNALFATQRLRWHHERDWQIFQRSGADLSMLQWLRSLKGPDLVDYCTLVPRLVLGLHLEPEHRVRAEALRTNQRDLIRIIGYRSRADRAAAEGLRSALDDYFGHRGRRAGDGMIAYRRRLSDVDIQIQYRLRYGVDLELELSHPSVPRLLLGMILATPTEMQVGLHTDVETAVRYVDEWLSEVAHLVGFEPGNTISEGGRFA